MKKRSIFFIISIAFLVFMFVSAYSSEEIVRIDNSAFINPQRTPSLFSHDEHIELSGIDECNICHHVYENGIKLEDETSEDQSCSECHKPASSDNIMPLRKAYHKRCKDCHITKKTGPVMCGECHLK